MVSAFSWETYRACANVGEGIEEGQLIAATRGRRQPMDPTAEGDALGLRRARATTRGTHQ
jgi:hypothetical protein